MTDCTAGSLKGETESYHKNAKTGYMLKNSVICVSYAFKKCCFVIRYLVRDILWGNSTRQNESGIIKKGLRNEGNKT